MSDLSIAAGPDLLTRAEPARRVSQDAHAAAASASPAAAAAANDSVEISDRARLLSRLRELPAVRADLIERVKANIEAGVYDGAEIPDAVIDRVSEDLQQFPELA